MRVQALFMPLSDNQSYEAALNRFCTSHTSKNTGKGSSAASRCLKGISGTYQPIDSSYQERLKALKQCSIWKLKTKVKEDWQFHLQILMPLVLTAHRFSSAPCVLK